MARCESGMIPGEEACDGQWQRCANCSIKDLIGSFQACGKSTARTARKARVAKNGMPVALSIFPTAVSKSDWGTHLVRCDRDVCRCWAT